ncbi:hypothetical protein CKAH01_11003 [Colletotrichum kahawae]|uniref:Uncharacterized protein n=1 Tax=Colletotrichum kahawae TaxID=34407 RepID=A0AAE0CX03_COLKA|nr:hypothetical protein CKAH01_11003 [Colletotrichum kahawae]
MGDIRESRANLLSRNKKADSVMVDFVIAFSTAICRGKKDAGASAVSEPVVLEECRIPVVTSEVKATRKRCIQRVRRQMRQVRHGQVRCQVASDGTRSRNVVVLVEATLVRKVGHAMGRYEVALKDVGNMTGTEAAETQSHAVVTGAITANTDGCEEVCEGLEKGSWRRGWNSSEGNG